ncbi:MAG: tetratricopeptide repeat protein, partial [Acidobacteria bacterium]|nr:tetratricopeptide repeat protein [Acidobacteriota bacterium]
MGKGYGLLQERSYELAAREFQAALALDPALTKARYELGVCYFASQRFKEARREFGQLISETEGDSEVLYYLGRLDLLEENFVGAISRLEKA